MDERGRDIEELATAAVDCAYKIHQRLGPGLLESVYETLLAASLEKRGFRADRQVPVDIEFDGMHFEEAFKADILVEGRLLIELKSIERTAPVHAKQVITYLRLMELPLGLLINFGAPTLREGVRRVVNGYNAFAS